MYYPEYPYVIPNAFFAYPWYGYAGNSMFYGSSLYQQTQQANIEQLNSKILELQIQQCCCNQTSQLNQRLSNMINTAPVPCMSSSAISFISYEEQKPKDWIYELDKIIFPDNPIRDYIEEEVRKIKEKYAKRIEKLNTLIV